MNRTSPLSNNAPQRVDAVRNSQAPAGNRPSASSRVQGQQDLREVSSASRLQAAQAISTVGITREQLKFWMREGRLTANAPKLEHPHNNENIAKEIRRDIVNQILERNTQSFQSVNQALLTLNGIDLPSALQQIAHAIAGDGKMAEFLGSDGTMKDGFIPPTEERHSSFTLTSTDGQSKDLIQLAIYHDHPDAIRALKELGANVNTPTNDGRTPVYIAAKNGCTDTIQTLKALGANVNTPNNDGMTPIYVAAAYGHADTIQTLKALGANVNTPNNTGATPVYIAAQNGHADAIRTLKALGANVNTPDNDGWTPVHIAAQNGHTDAIRTLKALGANVNTPMNDGRTPVFIAAVNGRTDTIRTLKELGANLNTPTHDVRTPSSISAQNGHTEAAQVINNLAVIHNRDAFHVINNRKQLTVEELKTWAAKTYNEKDAMLAIQAIMIALSYGHIEKNKTVQDEIAAILTAAQRNIVRDNTKRLEEQVQQIQLVEHLARMCLNKSVGLLNNTQYQTLTTLISHTISIEHLYAQVHETQRQIQNLYGQFQQHVFNVRGLAQTFQTSLNNLQANQENIADKIIEIGKRMRNIRIASTVVNTAQAAINCIPFAGPAISGLGGALYNAGVAAQAHDVLVGLHELKAGLASAATPPPDIKGITMGDIITGTQGTLFGQLKLSSVLDEVHEQYIYHQLGRLEKELMKPLPASAPANPQSTAGPSNAQSQQANYATPATNSNNQNSAASVASSSNQSSTARVTGSSTQSSSEGIFNFLYNVYERVTGPSTHSSADTIPDANPQLAVDHNDIQTPSTQDHDTSSVASSGFKTEDEDDYDNILMSAIKKNEDPEEFSSYLEEAPENINRSVLNRKGTRSTPLDFSLHYGRPELTRKLLKEKAQSAKTDIPARKPLELIQEARKNKGLYDNKGRRRQLLPQ